MKKKGNKIEFIADRDRELHKAFMELLAVPGGMPLREMYGAAASRPCSRFWVSEPRAAIVMGRMLALGPVAALAGMLPRRADMYRELFSRVQALLNGDDPISIAEATARAVNSPAPSFFLTDKSARVIIYDYTRRRRLARRLTAKTKTCHD